MKFSPFSNAQADSSGTTFDIEILTDIGNGNYASADRFGNIRISWPEYTTPDRCFKVYRADGTEASYSGDNWNSTGTDYTSVEKVRVLNIYPVVGTNTGLYASHASHYYLNNYGQAVTYENVFGVNDGKRGTNILPKSAMLKQWMEQLTAEGSTENYGKGKITVDPISVDYYNSLVNKYTEAHNAWVNDGKNGAEPVFELLYNADGTSKYDVIFYGTWDGNASNHIVDAGVDIFKEWIKSGRGFISGHDTISGNYSDQNIVRNNTYYSTQLKDYFGLELGTNTKMPGYVLNGYDQKVYIYDKVKIVETGLFNTYPWYIGDLGTLLSVPPSHTLGQEPTQSSKVWLKYVNGSEVVPDTTSTGQYNYFLVTKNNVGMIQTGHNYNDSADSERKIIANLIFYTNQLMIGQASTTDRGAQDTTKPSAPTIQVSNDGKFKASTTDRGNFYSYYVEAYEKNDWANGNYSNPTRSRISSTEVKSLVREYRYIFNSSANTEITSSTTGYQTVKLGSEYTLKMENGKVVRDTDGNYIYVNASGDEKTGAELFDKDSGWQTISGNYSYVHVVAVDGAGNISETSHRKLTDKQIIFQIEDGYWDNANKSNAPISVPVNTNQSYQLNSNLFDSIKVPYPNDSGTERITGKDKSSTGRWMIQTSNGTWEDLCAYNELRNKTIRVESEDVVICFFYKDQPSVSFEVAETGKWIDGSSGAQTFAAYYYTGDTIGNPGNTTVKSQIATLLGGNSTVPLATHQTPGSWKLKSYNGTNETYKNNIGKTVETSFISSFLLTAEDNVVFEFSYSSRPKIVFNVTNGSWTENSESRTSADDQTTFDSTKKLSDVFSHLAAKYITTDTGSTSVGTVRLTADSGYDQTTGVWYVTLPEGQKTAWSSLTSVTTEQLLQTDKTYTFTYEFSASAGITYEIDTASTEWNSGAPTNPFYYSNGYVLKSTDFPAVKSTAKYDPNNGDWWLMKNENGSLVQDRKVTFDTAGASNQTPVTNGESRIYRYCYELRPVLKLAVENGTWSNSETGDIVLDEICSITQTLSDASGNLPTGMIPAVGYDSTKGAWYIAYDGQEKTAWNAETMGNMLLSAGKTYTFTYTFAPSAGVYFTMNSETAEWADAEPTNPYYYSHGYVLKESDFPKTKAKDTHDPNNGKWYFTNEGGTLGNPVDFSNTAEARTALTVETGKSYTFRYEYEKRPCITFTVSEGAEWVDGNPSMTGQIVRMQLLASTTGFGQFPRGLLANSATGNNSPIVLYSKYSIIADGSNANMVSPEDFPATRPVRADLDPSTGKWELTARAVKGASLQGDQLPKQVSSVIDGADVFTLGSETLQGGETRTYTRSYETRPKIVFRIQYGTWADGTTSDLEDSTTYSVTQTLGDVSLPTGMKPLEGYDESKGTWAPFNSAEQMEAGKTYTFIYSYDLLLWQVTMDPGEGSGVMDSSLVVHGQKFTLPENKFTAPEGYMFTSWDLGAPGEQIIIEKDTTIIAKWEKIPVEKLPDDEGGTEWNPGNPDKPLVIPIDDILKKLDGDDGSDGDNGGGHGPINGVEIDGIPLNEGDYVYNPEDGTLTINPDVLKDLDPDKEHTIRVKFADVYVDIPLDVTEPHIIVDEKDVERIPEWNAGNPEKLEISLTDLLPEGVDLESLGGVKEIEIDGVRLTEGVDYILSADGNSIILLPAALAKLPAGIHQIMVTMGNGTITLPLIIRESYTFTFTKVWGADPQSSIDWTMYKPDGTVAHKSFSKQIISKLEWKYEATFPTNDAYFIVEKVPDGYGVIYENIAPHADVRDRCYNGGKIINYKLPRTGDNEKPWLWLGTWVLGLIGIQIILQIKKRCRNR